MTILLENIKGLRSPRNTSQIMNASLAIGWDTWTCHNMGHIAINCPMKAERVRKKNKWFQAHVAEDNDKKDEERAKKNEDSCEEYVLICAPTG